MATDWVVDKGLDKLLAQINAAAPNRSKASDGSIGDAAHQSRDSDHNPESPPPPGNPDRQVDARDFTHDPAHGADMGVVTEAIRRSRDRRVSYVIFNKRIFSSYPSTGGRPAWEWGPYTGPDPHDKHAHVSVNDIHHDETQDWAIGIDMTTPGQTDVIVGESILWDKAANRIDATGRNFANDVYQVVSAALVDEFGEVGKALAMGFAQMAGLLSQVQSKVDALEAKLDKLETGDVVEGNYTVSGGLSITKVPTA